MVASISMIGPPLIEDLRVPLDVMRTSNYVVGRLAKFIKQLVWP